MALTYRDEKGENLDPAEVDENFRTLKAITDDLEEQFATPVAITDIEGLSTALSQKIETSEKGANNGAATLNSEGKVVETALNSEQLGGSTLEDINASIAEKQDKNADAESFGGSDLFALDIPGSYFVSNVSGLGNSPLTEGETGEAFFTLSKRGGSKVIVFWHSVNSYMAIKSSGGSFGSWKRLTA